MAFTKRPWHLVIDVASFWICTIQSSNLPQETTRTIGILAYHHHMQPDSSDHTMSWRCNALRRSMFFGNHQHLSQVILAPPLLLLLGKNINCILATSSLVEVQAGTKLITPWNNSVTLSFRSWCWKFNSKFWTGTDGIKCIITTLLFCAQWVSFA